MAESAPVRRPRRVVVPPLYTRVERRINDLTTRILAALVQQIPLYARLPSEQLHGEISAIVADNLRIFFRSLREARPPTAEELDEFRLSAARRAEERVPLGALLAAYHLGASLAWEELANSAEPHEQSVLLGAANRVLEYLRAVTAAVAAAYLEEQQAIYGEEREMRRQLARALLAGEPTHAATSTIGLSVAPAYVVVVLRLGPHADEQTPGVGRAIAGRRKVRRVQDTLEAWSGEPVISLLDPDGGPVLLPVFDDDPQDLLARLPDLIETLNAAAGAPVMAGTAYAERLTDVPQQLAQASDVLGVAERTGRSPGVYRISDVLLEYQLSRPSDALPMLADLLDPLGGSPDLLLTLDRYLARDLDRRSTAADLHVHPNTLDYRLRRIVELTGLNPGTASGLQLLAAALAARRLQQQD